MRNSDSSKAKSGKSRSSMNALRHGATATALVLPGESVRAANALVRSVQGEFGLVGRLGQQFAVELAKDIRRGERVSGFEDAVVERQKAQAADVSLYPETKVIDDLQSDRVMIETMRRAIAESDDGRDANRKSVKPLLLALDRVVMRRATVAGKESPALADLQSPLLLSAEEGQFPSVGVRPVVLAVLAALTKHQGFIQAEIDRLTAVRAEKIRLAQESEAIPHEKELKRLERYRAMAERSMLRKLEILSKVKQLAAGKEPG